jgi:hypothetical protein
MVFISLCIVRALCLSSEYLFRQIHHRGTEFTEIAQRIEFIPREYRRSEGIRFNSRPHLEKSELPSPFIPRTYEENHFSN